MLHTLLTSALHLQVDPPLDVRYAEPRLDRLRESCIGFADRALTRYRAKCTGVEQFRKEMKEARAGENVGCLLRGVKREDIERGQVLAKPGSITPHKKFEAEVYCLSKDEGGRHTPFFSGYRPQFYFRTTDVTGTANLVGAEMCMPGDNVRVTVELQKTVAIDDGVRFAIREGGKTVGSGVVTKIIE